MYKLLPLKELKDAIQIQTINKDHAPNSEKSFSSFACNSAK